jgi:hypothetical protein
MDWNAALLAIIPLAGTGLGWLIVQSYRRSDERQERLRVIYKEMAEKAEKRAAKAEAREERAWAKARAYWRLLVENGIDPVPPIEDGDDL